MPLNKSTFFLILFVIFVLPFLIYNSAWILRSDKANGIARFIGKSYTGQFSKQYTKISFSTGKDTVWFNGMANYIFKRHEAVPIRYQRSDPSDARIDSFIGLWGDTLICMSPIFLIIVICFFHPDLVPVRSKIWLFSKKPFIQIV